MMRSAIAPPCNRAGPVPAVLALLLIFAWPVAVLAGEDEVVEAIAEDGRLVYLKPDGHWEYAELESGDPDRSAVLSVTDVRDMQDACSLQLRLQNNLTHKIRSIVPRFSVYNRDNIVYETKSRSFTSLRPTRDQYKRIQFNGIGCAEISWVRVHGADRCTIGDIVDPFNEEEGQCLSLIYVQPSEEIRIGKQLEP
jgi:hypothetical protein